jgi:hypothetical protein
VAVVEFQQRLELLRVLVHVHRFGWPGRAD